MAAIASVRAALVQCPVWGVEDPPLGLAQIAGCVTHCNQEAFSFDLNVRFHREAPEDLRPFWAWDRLPFWTDPAWCRELVLRTEAVWDRYVEDVLRPEPHVVAFSVAAGSQWMTLELARRLKRRAPATTILMGGPYFQASGRAEEFLSDGADIVVVGVGEDVVPKLLGLFRVSGRWTPLPGVLIKGPDGIVRGGRSIPYTFDLDVTPPPDFTGLVWGDYERPEQLPVSASRGCMWECVFCSSRGFWKGYSFKGGDRIFGDVWRAMESNRGGRFIRFYDIMANGKLPNLLHFSDRMRDSISSWGPLGWTINAAPTKDMTREALDRLRAGGCAEIVYGVESGSAKVLAGMKRPVDSASAAAVLRDTHEAGIRAVASLMIGFPGEDEAAFEETAEWLRRNRAWLDAVCVTAAAHEEPSALYRLSDAPGISPQRAADRTEKLRALAAELGIEVDGRFFAAGTGLTAPVTAA